MPSAWRGGFHRSLSGMGLPNAEAMTVGFVRWVEAERGRFALWLPVAMTAGVLLYFELAEEPAWWVGVVVLALAGVGARAFRRRRSWCFGIALVAAGGLGFGSAQFATERAAGSIEVPSRATFVSGTVRAVEVLPAGRRVVVTRPRFDDGPELARALRIRLRAGDATPLAAGDVVRVRAMIQRPSPPAYPGGWDLQRDAFYAGMGGFGSALGISEVVSSAAPEGPFGWIQLLREAIAGRVAGVLGGTSAGIATTLLTGISTAIPPADRAAFRDSGLAHLLAIAGLHIGIVMGLVFGATRGVLALSERAALFWPLKTIAACNALIVGFLYLVLTGAHVPIMRSFAMASLVTLGVIVGRRALSLRGLALAMAGIVLIAPNEVVGVSFQMSFSAVLALIVGYAALAPWLARVRGDGGFWRGGGSHLIALALTSALAGTFSAPFAAYHFGHVQLYFVVANMIAVPITVMLVMPAGLIALLLIPLHLEQLALVPMGWGIEIILWIARSVSSWPAATLPVPHMPPWGLVAFGFGLAWLGLWRTRLRLAGVAVVAAGLVSPSFATLPDILVSADGRLVGYRTAGVMLLQKTSGGSAFTQDAWEQYWSVPPAQVLDCATPDCLLRPRPEAASALLVRHGSDPGACFMKVLVSAEPIRLRCSEKVPSVDRFSVWRNGAYAIWLRADGVTIVSDREVRGERPWVLGLRLAGKVPANTVPALAE